MIIDSSFHDYYDAVAKSGVNREVRYLREPIEVPIVTRSWRRPTFRRTYLWFCGKIYRIVGFISDEIPHDKLYFFNIAEVDEYIKRLVKTKVFEYYLGKRKRHPDKLYYARGYSPNTPVRKDIDRFFNTSISFHGDAVVRELAEKHASPIVTYDYDLEKAIVNDQLSKFHLARLIDPYTAFQEIMMYLGGMAKPEKPIPAVSNSDMVEAKGFDLRTSFRKDPQRG